LKDINLREPAIFGVTMSLENLGERLRSVSWLKKVFVFACIIFLLDFFWSPSGMFMRTVEKLLVFVLIPLIFVRIHRRKLGLKFDRNVLIQTIILCSLVLPVYVLGASLPVMRSYYPVGDVPLEPVPFALHQFQQFFLALGTEVYYRGVLCVWIKEIGPKSILVSPLIYAFRHLGKPSPEVMASGPADAIFGYFDYKSDSIVPSVIAHWLGMVLIDFFSSVYPLFPDLGLKLQEQLYAVLAIL
jgi:membrane protease YdiL (CAAX protease family)